MMYTPESSVGWLAANDAEADEVRRLMAAFAESETLDSLGIGPVRDGIANQLFPGTSTIQTRARYFIFLPWIFLQMERERVPSSRFAPELRAREVQLIESLRRGAPGETGIIGVAAGRDVKRLPSSIYWGGLGSWGIRTRSLSMREYGRSLDALYRHRDERTPEDSDDSPDPAHITWLEPPVPWREFLSGPVDLSFTRPESEYLENRIMTNQAGSLLDEIVRRRSAPSEDWPWLVPSDHLDADLRSLLRHAELFSLVMHGAQFLYCIYLAIDAADKLNRSTSDMADSLRERYAEWQSVVEGDSARIGEWARNPEDFWQVVTAGGARVNSRTRGFAEEWARRVINGLITDPADPSLRAFIVERERHLKKRLARLSYDRPLENWQGNPIGIAPLDYRWSVTRQLVSDIADPWSG